MLKKMVSTLIGIVVITLVVFSIVESINYKKQLKNTYYKEKLSI